MDKVAARAQFMDWVKRTHPGLFGAALEHAEDWREGEAARQGNPGAISGLGSFAAADGGTVTGPTNFWGKFAEGLTAVGTAYLGYKGQKTVLETNLLRAQQGLPPIDPTTGAPMVRTSLSLSPEIMARLNDTGGTLQKFAIWGGLAFLGYTVAKKMRLI